MFEKLEDVEDRFQEVEGLLAQPDILADQGRYRDLSREHAELIDVVTLFRAYRELEHEMDELRELSRDQDPEMRALASQELPVLAQRHEELAEQLTQLMLPRDPNDGKNAILEIRAGTGGDEAALFAGDMFRAYARFADKHRWKVEILSSSESSSGGFKEVIAMVSGKDVFSFLKYESGTHRVQRVPDTETQGRVHTSACTVAVLPEAEDVDLDIDPSDLRIDLYRASGAGGQHVNKTESAVRITHIPT